ncbi:hypothetical protein NT2_10_00590 [Caenibius tardaugens NBRC 16725]|uniref:Uncharacterized protein n=1 Tax=Caenibius tardaugens NBRC 16725 TaxID=1219035 RepID=U2ZYZ6_9SPHN|nr:hypothetical protein [Caenibius tardaugens]AZI35815.1 hypothetical protein EGO55_07360 [Caenibius tardaugens NBRC 16725]GAD50614.1 hypothetical protein NT2_10_00590 [Caenibius tardaugens NBRC 16725]
MNLKRVMVDAIGYASMVPFFMLYNYLERVRDDYVAVLIPFIAFLPIAAIWRFYYRKYSR